MVRGGWSVATGRETWVASSSWRARHRGPLPHPRSLHRAYRKQTVCSPPRKFPSATRLIFSSGGNPRRVARGVSRAVLSTSQVRSRGDEETAGKLSPRRGDRKRHRGAVGAAAGRRGRSSSSLPHAFSGEHGGGWPGCDDPSVSRSSARLRDLVTATMCRALRLSGGPWAR